jgi:hypothetical protein
MSLNYYFYTIKIMDKSLIADYFDNSCSIENLDPTCIYFGLPSPEKPDMVTSIYGSVIHLSDYSAKFKLCIRPDKTCFLSGMYDNYINKSEIPSCYFPINNGQLLNVNSGNIIKLKILKNKDTIANGYINKGFNDVSCILGGRIFKDGKWIGYPCIIDMEKKYIKCNDRIYNFSKCMFCVVDNMLKTFKYKLIIVPFYDIECFKPPNETIKILRSILTQDKLNKSLIDEANVLFDNNINGIININISNISNISNVSNNSNELNESNESNELHEQQNTKSLVQFTINDFLKPLFGEYCPFFHGDRFKQGEYDVNVEIFNIVLLCVKRIYRNSEWPFELLEEHIGIIE